MNTKGITFGFKKHPSLRVRAERIFSFVGMLSMLFFSVYPAAVSAVEKKSVQVRQQAAITVPELPMDITIASNAETYRLDDQAIFTIDIAQYKHKRQKLKVYFPNDSQEVTNRIEKITNTQYQFTSDHFEASGEKMLTVEVYGKRGRLLGKNSHRVSVIAPVLQFTQPASDEYFSVLGNEALDIQLAYSDAEGDLRQKTLEVSLDGEDVSDQMIVQPNSAYGTILNVEPGEHTLHASVQDADALEGETEWVFTHIIDNTAPVITFAQEDAFEVGKRNIMFSGAVIDSNLENAELRVTSPDEERESEMLALNADGTFAHSVSFMQEGEHTVTVRATDKAGWEVEQSVEIRAQFDGPKLSFVSPESGTTTACTVSVVATTADANASHTMTVTNPWNTAHADDNDGQGYIQEYAIQNISEAGEITQQVELVNGQNSITFSAIDSRGNASSIEQQLFCDRQQPRITFTTPQNQYAVYDSSTVVDIEVKDKLSSIQAESFVLTVFQETAEERLDVTDSLNVDIHLNERNPQRYIASGSITGFQENTIYVIEVSVQDEWGNTETSFSRVIAAPADVTPPEETEESGIIRGTVVDSSTCNENGEECEGLAGAEITVSVGAPGQENVAGTAISGPTGAFGFPTPESDTYYLKASLDGYTYAQREIEVIKEKDTFAGTLQLTPAQTATLTNHDGQPIDAITSEEGGVATSTGIQADGEEWSVVVDIPAGALPEGEELPEVNVSWFENVEYLETGELPPGTEETYAFNIAGEEPGEIIEFEEPITVEFSNTRDFPATFPDNESEAMKIPVGAYNPETMEWEAAGQATAVANDGDATAAAFRFETETMRTYDCNDPVLSPETTAEKTDENEQKDASCCEPSDNGNSSVVYDSGELKLSYALPGVKYAGETEELGLTYSSIAANPSALISSSTTLEGNAQGQYTNLQWNMSVAGQEVERVYYDVEQDGKYQFQYLFDGRDAGGERLATGVYPIRVNTDADYLGQYYYSMDGEFGAEPDLEYGATGVYEWFTQQGGYTDEIQIQNLTQSPFGSGWTLDDMQQLHKSEDGYILATHGHDKATFFDSSQYYENAQEATQEDPEESPEGQRAAEPFSVQKDVLTQVAQEKKENGVNRQKRNNNLAHIEKTQAAEKKIAKKVLQQQYRERQRKNHREVSGTISEETTWTVADSPYVLTADVTVTSTGDLTIEPGVVVKIDPTARFRVDGVLNAIGTPEAPIVFTSIHDDTHGGDTDGEDIAPQPGDWRYVYFSPNSQVSIDHNYIAYGGDADNSWSMVSIYSDTVSIQNTTLKESEYSTVYMNANATVADSFIYGNESINYSAMVIYQASPTIQRNTVTNGFASIWTRESAPVLRDNIVQSAEYGILFWDGVPSIYRDNIIEENTYPMYIAGNITSPEDYFQQENTYRNNRYAATYMTATVIGEDAVLGPNTISDTYLIDDLDIGITGSLTISEGTQLKFEFYEDQLDIISGVYAQGDLIVDGTDENPVVFTSRFDDSAGVDTDTGDDERDPLPGDWEHVYIVDESNSQIRHAEILYAGRLSSRSSLRIYSPTVTVENTYIDYSAHHGTFIDLSDFTNLETQPQISNAVIRSPQAASGLVSIDASPQISDTTVTGAFFSMLFIEGSPELSGNTFTDSRYGPGFSSGMPAIYENNIIDNNDYPLVISGDVYQLIDFAGTNDYRYNSYDAPMFSATLNEDITFGENLFSSTYIIDGVAVAEEATLTVEPGTVLKFTNYNDPGYGTTLTVDGALIAEGTTDEPIIFTSEYDDEYGVETDVGYRENIPQAGDWRSIHVTPTGSAQIENAIMQYGGYAADPEVNDDASYALFRSGSSNTALLNSTITQSAHHGFAASNGASITLDNMHIHSNASAGIVLRGGEPSVTYTTTEKNTIGVLVEEPLGSSTVLANNNIQFNTEYGVNNTSGEDVDANNNWWGHETGPYHLEKNSAGEGNAVSDNVLFYPWLEEEESVFIPGIISLTETDHSWLTYHGESDSYRRHYPDGKTIYFNQNGTHDRTVERTGVVKQYSYNENEQLARIDIRHVNDATPQLQWIFSYDASGTISNIDIIDEQGNAITSAQFVVDESGDLVAITNAESATRSFTYDQDHLAQSKTLETGETMQYRYNDYGRIVETISPEREIVDEETREIGFGIERRLFTPSDTLHLINDGAQPIVGTFEEPADLTDYDDVVATESTTGTTQRKTNPYSSTLYETDALGRTTQYERDENNNVTTVLFPEGNCVERTYDEHANVLSEQRMPQSECVKPVEERNPENIVSEYWTYDERYNQVKTHTNANGHTTTYYFDYEMNVQEEQYSAAYASQGSRYAGNVWRIEYPEVETYNAETDSVETVVPTTSFTYTPNGQLRTAVDERGNVTTYEYSENGREHLVAVIEPEGITTTHADFDAFGNSQTMIDPNGNVASYEYSPEDGVLTAVNTTVDLDHDDVDETIRTEYVYDERNNLVEERRDTGGEREFVISTEYNAHDQIQKTTSLDTYFDQAITLERYYDHNRNLAEFVDGNGNSQSWIYDDANQIVEMKKGNYSEVYTYDQNGNLETVETPNAAIARYSYDALDRLTSTVENWLPGQPGSGSADENQERNVETAYEYDGNGNVTQRIVPSGMVSTATYNALNHPTSITRDSTENPEEGYNLVRTMHYDAAGNMVREIDERGVHNVYSYDALDRTEHVRQDATEKNLETAYEYDDNGNVVRMQDYRGIVSTKEYDALDRVINTTEDVEGLAYAATTYYDRLGNVGTMVDANGMYHANSYDGFGNLISDIKDENGIHATTTRQYDNNGNLVTITDSHSNTTTYAYDALNRLRSTQYPDGTQETQTYTAQGNLDSQITQRGDELQFTHDAIDRLTAIEYSAGNTQNFRYDTMGREVFAQDTNQQSTVTQSYNALGDIASSVQRIENNEQIVGYAYDYAQGEYTITYPSGRVITKTKDALGRMETIQEGENVVVEDVHNDQSGTIARTYDNGILSETTLDALYRTSAIASPVGEYTYTYDAVHNPTAVTRGHHTGNAADAYQYDTAHRITGVHYAADSTEYAAVTNSESHSQFAIDALGNRLTVQHDDSLSEYNPNNTRKNLDVMNQYTAIDGEQLQYDDNGNIIVDERNTYTYDALNRVVEATNALGENIQYHYDAFGRRIQKQVNDTQTQYFYDGDDILEEQSPTGDVERSYVYGLNTDEPIQFRDHASDQEYYYHADALGSITELTDTEGALVEAYEYDVYGTPHIYTTAERDTEIAYTASIQNPYLFTARQYDAETANYYYRARYYSPTMGRFISTDPREYIDGMNRYEYVRSNPTSYVDPSGELIPFIVGAWGVVEFGMSAYDAYSTYKTVSDPCVSYLDKAFAVGEFAVGLAIPGNLSMWKNGGKYLSNPVQRPRAADLSTEEFVQRLANKAEKWGARNNVGEIGTGSVQGTLKHKRIEKVLNRYQRMTGEKSNLISEKSFVNGELVSGKKRGSAIPDIFDKQTGNVFDFKFDKRYLNDPHRPLSKSQRNKNIKHLPYVNEQKAVVPKL